MQIFIKFDVGDEAFYLYHDDLCCMDNLVLLFGIINIKLLHFGGLGMKEVIDYGGIFDVFWGEFRKPAPLK